MEQVPTERAKELAKERDEYECQFCGITRAEHRNKEGEDLHAHHIIKSADNGPDHPRNLITLCRECHNTFENTHADALSQIRQSIIDEVKEQEEAVESVEKGLYYHHSRFGIVYVRKFKTERIGVDESGEILAKAVVFTQQSADHGIRLVEPYETFTNSVTVRSEHSHEVQEQVNEDA